jgi:hypothetical protein
MKMTLDIRGDLMARAADFSGIRDKNALVQAGLQVLIVKKAGERLAALGGSEPGFRAGRRNRIG